MNPIYFVTVVDGGRGTSRSNKNHGERCWGWFSDYATAEKAVLANWTDMFEDGYYDFAVIEEVKEGLCVYCPPEKCRWFYADYRAKPEHEQDGNPLVTPCDAPLWSQSLIGWCF